jgi:hypothetical protein
MMMEDRFEAPEKFATASDQLHELVAGLVGSSDFGDGEYRRGLKVLLQSMDYDPHFTPWGRKLAWGQLICALSGRAHAARAMAQLPGFDRLPVDRPVVITGIPRTGTTALHKLMAVDPQFQGLQEWLIAAPMPRPPRETWESNPHFQHAVAQLNARFAATPDLRAAHNMVADEVDESLGILCHSFVSNLWACCGYSAATYDAWWQCQSELSSYRYFRRTLQLVGSNDPGKRWLLKNPGDIANLDLLFAVFPDAMVIQTHRDPAKAIPSLCALLMQGFAIMEEGRHEARAHTLINREAAKWSKAVRDAERVREAHRHQIVDVIHGDFHRDPIGTVKRIYAFLGLTLSRDVEAAMAERVAAAPELSHGVHRYNVADFGVTEDEIREYFGPYLDRFDLRPRASIRTKETVS